MNYYNILEINYKATKNEIKKAYHKLILKYHPDRNNSSDAIIITQKLNEAYETLYNFEKKQKYDEDNNFNSNCSNQNNDSDFFDSDFDSDSDWYFDDLIKIIKQK